MKNRLVEYWLPLLASFWLLMLSGLTVSYADVPLNIYNGKDSVEFSCNTLYAGEAGRGNTQRRVFVVELDQANGTTVPITPLYQPAAVTGLDSEPTATIALGPWGGAGGTLTMYHWYWGANSVTHYVKEGKNPIFTTLVPNPPKPGTGSYNYWSGGEVFQETGEIYYSGGEDSTFYNNFRLMKHDPVTGNSINSGRINPASASDNFLERLYISSDMAIDGEGNAYVVVGNSRTNRHLVRIVTTNQSGNWTYNHVRELSDGPNGTDIWGMAFLNGKLYLNSAPTYVRSLYSFDTLTGQGTYLGLMSNRGGHTGPANSYPNNEAYYVDDLSACQTAPVIKGTVYHDKKGEGNKQDFETLPEQKVEIWKATASGFRYYSTINTSGQGDFSFIVDDSRGSDYYVRFADPNIGGKPAVQSWANAGMYGPSSVVSQCINPTTGVLEETNQAGACLGRYTDAAAAQGDPTTWGVFQKVLVRTDSEVPDASIAITTVANYGDAPAGYGAPAHISPGVSGNDSLNVVRLGDTVSIQTGPQPSNDANRITSHDGVEVANAGANNYVRLQDMIFVSGVKYTFRVSVQGEGASRAYLNGWMDWSNGRAAGSFSSSSQIVKDQQLTSAGYITFDYTVPSAASVGVKPSFARFRISTQAGIDSVEVSTANKKIDGEVEDYRVYFVPGDLSISTVTQGAVGTFKYEMTNISAEAPSQDKTEITVLREDEETFAGTRHAFSNIGQPIIITQTSVNNAAPFQLLAVNCSINGQEIPGITVENGEKITIPGSHVQGSTQISCKFINSAGPRVELVKSVAGRSHANDQFTVQIKDGSTILDPAKGSNPTTSGTGNSATTGKLTLEHNQTYTLTEIMAAGSESALGRYDTSISCVNNTAGSSTATPSGEGTSFDITPKNGDDIVCTITNTPIKISTEHSQISANPDVITADGQTKSTITVKLFKDSNEAVTVGGDKVEVFFTEADHKGDLVGDDKGTGRLEAHDNGDGTYFVEVTSLKTADKESIGYEIVGVGRGDKTAEVTYVFGEPSAEFSEITADPTTIGADGAQKSTLTVRLFDANGNPITASKDAQGDLYDIEIIYVDLAGKVDTSVLSATSSPNDDGLFIATVTSETTGTDNFTFTIKGKKATGTDNEAAVTYTAGAPSTSHSKITANPSSILADGTTQSELKVQLYDGKGNLITSDEDPETNVKYQIKIVYVDSNNATDNNKVLSSTSYDANGAFIASITSKTAGEDEFTFEIDTVPADPSNADGKATVKYTAGEADSSASKIKTDPKEIAADGQTPSTITITLYDKNGNPLTSGSDLAGKPYDVVVFSTNKDAELGELSNSGVAHNNDDGTFTVTVTSTKKGREDFGFKVNTVESVGNTDHVTYLVGEFDPANSTIIASPNPIAADGNAKSKITVQLKDANNNDLDGNPGYVYIMGVNLAEQTPIDPEEGIRANYDGAGGRYYFELSSIKAGTEPNIGFRFVPTNGSSTPGDKTTDLTYLAGAVNSGMSTISVNPTSIVADLKDTATITIVLKDSNENEVSPETAEAAASHIALHFNGKGEADAIGIPTKLQHVAGTATYTATMTSKVANTKDDINFSWDGKASAARPAQLSYVAGDVVAAKSTITASPTEIEADGTAKSAITVQLRDEFGNEVINPGRTYNIKLDYSNPADKKGDIIPADGTMISIGSGKYQAHVTSEKQGEDTFKFEVLTDNLGEGQETATVTYKMGGISATNSKIWVDPKEITTNEGDRATIYVQLMDAKDNKPADHEYDVFISNPASLKGKTISGTTLTDQFEYVSEGLYKLDIYSEVADKDTLKFEYRKIGATGAGIIGSDSDVITYIAGDVDMTASTIVIAPNSIVADDTDRARVTVQLRDRFGNPILKNMGEVTIADLDIGELNTAPKNDLGFNANGTYSAFITSIQSGEDKEVGFRLNGGDKSDQVAAITYTAGKVNLEKSEISVQPSTITADEVDIAIITIQFKDWFGNNVEGEVSGVINVETFKYGHRKDPNNARFMGDGKYEIDVISQKIGTDTLKASLGKDVIARGQTVDITYIAGEATAENSVISANPPVIEADNTEVSVLTVQLRDKFNNNLDRETTKAITLDQSTLIDGKLAKEDGNYTFDYSGSNGRYVLSIKSDKVGDDDVNFKLDNVSGPVSGAAHVKYEQGSVSLVASTFTVDPTEIIADGQDKSTVTVQLKDASGHTVDDDSRVITIVGLDPTIGAIATELKYQADGRYVGTITSMKSGVDTLNYHIKDLGTGDDNQKKTLTYVAGEYSLVESLITIQPATIKADGQETARVVVQLRDANKNNILVNDAKVALKELTKGRMKEGDGKDFNLKSIGNGQYEGFIVSIVSGGEDVGFMVDTKPAQNSQRITYTPGDADLTQSLMSADPTQVEANGLEKSKITVQLRDRYGNNVDRKQGDVYLVKPADAKGQSDNDRDQFEHHGNGRYTLNISSKEAGRDTFNFRLEHVAAPQNINATITYVAGGADTKNSTITANPAIITADGKERSELIVQLRDGEGNSLTDGINQDTDVEYVIRLVSKNADNKIIGDVSDLTMRHTSNGQFVTYVTSTIAAIDEFSFTIEGRPADSQTKVTYRAGKADPSASIIRANPESIEVSTGNIISTLTVELRDANNNPVTTRTDKVEIFSENKIGELSATDQGTYQATVSSKKTGTELFKFRLNDESADDTATVRYTPGAYDLSQSTINALPDTIAADGKEKSTIVVQLKDAFGNNLTTNALGEVYIIGVKLAQQVATNPKPLAGYTSGGRYEVELTSIKAGVESDIRFETPTGERGEDQTTLTYLPGKADLSQSVITVNKSSLIADNSDEAIITVELRDSKGNRLQSSQGDVKLRFNGTNGSPVGIPKPDAGVKINDHNDGTYTATITSIVANKTDSITFSLDEGNGDVVSGAAPASINYVAGEIDLDQTVITANPTTIEANGEEKSTITVQLRDAFGNDILTRAPSDDVRLTRTTHIGDVESEGRLSFIGNGQYTTTVTSKVADTETFGYTIGGLDGKGSNGKATITYQTGGISLVRSELDITPETITANGEMEAIVTVQLLDQQGNKPSDNPGVVKLTGIKDGKLVDDKGDFEIAHVSEGLYRGTITSEKAGFDTIGFKYNDADAQAKKVLTYTAGEVDLTKSTIVINPATITANGVARATAVVQLVDKFNNNITENKGDIALILEFGKVNNSNSKVLTHQANGTYTGTITSTVATTEEIGFQFVGQAAAGPTAPLTYTAGPMNLATSTITLDPKEIVANDSDESTITVQFKDVFGNNITEPIVGEVKLDIEGVQTGKTVKDLTVVAGDNGKYIATVKSEKAGFDNIGFRVDANLGAGGKRETVTYLAGKADITKTRFSANPTSIVANDATTATLKVELFDTFGNRVDPKSTDDVEIIFKDGTTSLGDLEQTVRGADGSFTARVKSQTSGVATFDFKLNTTTAHYDDVTVTYTAGTANARMSEISADPVSITADGATQSTVTVQLKDQFGNKLTEGIGAGAVVITHVGERTGDAYVNTATDNGDGTYSTKVTSKKVGDDTFGFMVLTVSGGANNVATVAYTAGEASAAQSEISVVPAVITADGTTEAIVTITLKDAFGNRLNSNGGLTPADLELIGILKGDQGTLTYAGGDSGRFTAPVTSTVDGEDTISFILDKQPATGAKKEAKLEYRSGGYSLTTSTIELSKPEIIADEVDQSIVTVILRDQYKNIVTDLHIVELVGLKTGHLEIEGSVALRSVNGDGIYTGTITSRKTGLADELRFAVIEDGKSNVSQDSKSLSYVAGEASIETSIITVNPVSITANDHDESTVTVQLRDKFGNNLDRQVDQGVKLDEATLVLGKSVSGSLDMNYTSGGRYTLTIKSTKTGVDPLNYIIVATGDKGKTPAALTYTAGAVSLKNSTITVDPEEIVADGVTRSKVTVQFVDAFGNNLTTNAGRVTLGAGMIGKLVNESMTYQAGTGSYVGYITSEKSGFDNISYAIEGVGLGEKTAKLTYIPGVVDLNETTILASPSTIKADGEETSIITIQLRDAKGNIVPEKDGEAELLEVTHGIIHKQPQYIDNGRYEAEIRSTKAETDIIGYQLSTKTEAGKNRVSVTYTPGDYDLEFSTIDAEPKSIEANGTTRSKITVQLKDRHSNNVLGNPTDVYATGIIEGNFNDEKQYRFVPEGDGRYVGYVTSKKAGEDTIGFTAGGNVAKGKTTTVSYFAGDMDPTISTITASPREILANGVEVSIVTVQLKDSNGNNLTSGTNAKTNQPYKVVLVSESKPGVGIVEPATLEMQNNQDGTFTAKVTSVMPGSEIFGFTVDGHTGLLKETITYSNGNGNFDQSKSSITTNPKEIDADGKSTSTVTVTLVHAGTDAPLTGLTSGELSIITADGKPMIGDLGSMSEAKGTGIYTYTMTSTEELGTDTLTFETKAGRYNGEDTIKYGAGDGNFDQESSTITANPMEIDADGVMTSTVTVTMYFDKDGQKPIIGYQGLELVSATTDAIIGKVVYDKDHGDGRYTFTVTSDEFGDDTFRFKTRAYESKDTAMIKYTAGDGKFDQESSTITADPMEIDADGVMTSTVTVTMYFDKDGQKPIIGYQGLELVSATTDAIIGKVAYDKDHGDGRYTFTVTSDEFGDDTFRFKTRAYESKDTAMIKYTAGDGNFNQESSTITADPMEIDADGVMTSTVTVTMYFDKDGQKPIIGYQGLELVSATTDAIIGKVVYDKDHGDGRYTFTVTSDEFGDDTFRFKTRAYESKDTAMIKYTAGDGNFNQESSTITADPMEIDADGVMTSTVTVTMYFDKDGQKPIIGYQGLELVSATTDAIIGKVVYDKDHGDGRYTFTVTSDEFGEDTFRFKTRAYESKDTAMIKYTAGDGNFDQESSTITADPMEIDADGVMTSTVTVTMYFDKDGQKPIIGYQGLELVSATTDAIIGKVVYDKDHGDGRYTFTVTSDEFGDDTFRFKTRAYESKDTAMIKYTAGDGNFNQESSTITADPMEIDADGVMTSTVTVTMYFDKDGQKPIIGYQGLELVSATTDAIIGKVVYDKDHGDGRYTFTVTSDEFGDDTFRFKTRAYESKDTAMIKYTAGDGNFNQESSTITADPMEIDADGVMTSTVTVTMYFDKDGQKPIIGYQGLELVSATTDAIIGKVVYDKDHGDGRYTFTVTSDEFGEDTFRFKTRAYESKDTAMIKYTAGDGNFDQESSTITADPMEIDADGVMTSTVTVTMYFDKDGQKPIIGYQGLELVSATTDAIIGKVVYDKDHGDGRYTFTVTSDEFGDDTFRFKTRAYESKDTAMIKYTAGDGNFDQESSTITADPMEIDADGVMTSTVTVTMYFDKDGQKPIIGYQGLELVSATTDAIIGKVVYDKDHGDGRYTFTVTSDEFGDDTFRFKTRAYESKDTAMIKYTAGDGNFDQESSTITADPMEIDADGVMTSTVTVTMYFDKDGQKPIIGYQGLELVSATTDAIIGKVVYDKDHGDGRYTFTVTSDEFGDDTFRFKTRAYESKDTAMIKYTAGDGNFDQESSTITADPMEIDADGVMTSTVTVTMYFDKDGQKPIIGYQGLELVSATTDAIIGKVVYDKDHGDGRYTFTVTSDEFGDDTFRFKTRAYESKDTAMIKYTAGDGNFNQESSTITADPMEIDADGVMTSTVTVTMYFDKDGQKPIIGYQGLELVSATTDAIIGKVVYDKDHGDGRYTFTVTSDEFGDDTFRFKTRAYESKDTAMIKYTAGDGNFDQESSTITADPMEIDADGVMTSTVTVTMYFDKDGQKPIIGYQGLELVSATTDAIIGKVVYDKDHGDGRYTFTVTSDEFGEDTFRFKTRAYESKDTAMIKYTAGDGNFDQESSTITADPMEIDADGVMTSTVTVTMYFDKDGQKPIIGYQGLELVSATTDAIIGKVVYDKDHGDGRYTFTVTSDEFGDDTFRFKTRAYESKDTAMIKYTAGDGNFDQDSSTITADPTEIDADGQMKSTVTVKMFYDKAGQKPLTGYEGLELISKDGKAIVGDVVYVDEVAEGVYTFEVTSKTVGEDNFAFRTKAKPSDKSVIVKYIAGGTFDEDKSSIVADPEVIDADGIEQSKVTVKLFYANGLPIKGHTPQTLSLVTDGQQVGIVAAAGTFESAPGVYEFDVTSVVEGKEAWKFQTDQQTSLKKADIEYLQTEDALLLIRLTASNAQLKVGDVVMITANVKNIGNVPADPFNIINSLPGGFSYVANSAKAESTNGGMSITGNSPLDLGNLELAAGSEVNIRFVVRIGAGIKPGNNTLYAEAFMDKQFVTRAVETRSISISNRASLILNVADSDPLFDDSLIIGTVYHDRNGNGMQDPGEPGIPGVRIASAEGLIITTDQFGRYHLKDIKGGKWERGRNYILKIDKASLPEGVTFVTPNPLVRRITPGLPTRFDFAVQLPEESILEVSEALFVNNKARIKPEYEQHLVQMVELIEEHEIKEITITTWELGTLSEEREEYLQKLLNSKLNDENRIIVGSESQEVEGK